jgi:hypothetical protein
MCYPIFPNFKVITFKEWSMQHKEHKKEIDIMEAEGRKFRFCVCLECGEYYYMGEIK